MPRIEPADILIDDDDRHLLGGHRWRRRSDGYIIRSEHVGWSDGRHQYRRIYLHRLIMGAQPGQVVDHINGVPSDNRRANLRIVTQAINAQSRNRRITSPSGYRGVSLDRASGKWVAYGKVNGKSYRLGSFVNILDAARAAHEWRMKNLPGYADMTADVPHNGRPFQPRPRRASHSVVYCACGCGKIVRDPKRRRFAHGGAPRLAHGELPPGCLIDDTDRDILIGRSWHVTSSGYVAARIGGRIRLLHRLITAAPDGYVVDHINRNGLDNRRCNLRVVTQSENIRAAYARKRMLLNRA